jgi:hypothetical protein
MWGGPSGLQLQAGGGDRTFNHPGEACRGPIHGLHLARHVPWVCVAVKLFARRSAIARRGGVCCACAEAEIAPKFSGHAPDLTVNEDLAGWRRLLRREAIAID